MTNSFSQIAPAKVNLYLHVGRLRNDGLHELASLFVFAQAGDIVSVKPPKMTNKLLNREITLEIKGPFAKGLTQFPLEDNLVLKAAHALREYSKIDDGAAIILEKNLPIAAGIGGGSADAAATLRVLIDFWSLKIDDEALTNIAFSLGADVPACLWQKPILVSGAGETIQPAAAMPPLWIVLINPGIATPTGPIFKAFDQQNPKPRVPQNIEKSPIIDINQLQAIMAKTRNDLEGPACSFVPIIEEVKEFIQSQEGVLLARMSGSGATCFGLFASHAAAKACADRAKPLNWWALSAKMISNK